jgi:predicted hydrocarbon binding protein
VAAWVGFDAGKLPGELAAVTSRTRKVSSMGRIKGAAIRARLDFLRQQHGETALAKVVETLDPMDQVVLSGTILPSIWYPFHILANLDEAMRRDLGDGSHDLFEEAGDHVARQHARSIYKVFFHETDPERVLRLASCIFTNYYSGLGRLSIRTTPQGSCRIQVGDAPTTARSHCVATMAYFRRVLEECCARPIVARETRCKCWGEDCCEFEFSWEKAQQLKQAV